MAWPREVFPDSTPAATLITARRRPYNSWAHSASHPVKYPDADAQSQTSTLASAKTSDPTTR